MLLKSPDKLFLWRLVPTLWVSILGSGGARQQFEAFGFVLVMRRSKYEGDNARRDRGVANCMGRVRQPAFVNEMEQRAQLIV